MYRPRSLLGTTRDKVMPEVPRNQVPYVGFDKVAFASILTLENLLGLAFVLGVTLGIARALLMVPFWTRVWVAGFRAICEAPSSPVIVLTT